MERIKTIKIDGDNVILSITEIKEELEWLESMIKKYDKPEYKPLCFLMRGRADELEEILKKR